MMGSKARIFRPITVVSLEELVPANHFYRQLDRVVDLSFVRDLVKETYAERGRPSIDPVVFFKLQLVMFFDDIRSERLLMQLAADRLSVRWYVGYNLDEPLPDHSILTRIRERYGVELFRCFFEAIVDQCQQAGLVWGKELYVDATKVNANASMESVKPRFAVEAHLANLFAAEPEGPAEEAQQLATQGEPASREPSPQEVMAAPVELPSALSAEQRAVLTQQNEERHDWIERQGCPDREVTHGSYQRVADFRISTTDPDATIMPTKGDGRHLGYHTHYVVDGGKARIILAALVTPSEVMENQPALDLLWRVRFRWKLWPRQMTGDTTYGTVDNIVALAHEHIHAYVPLPDFDHRTPFYGQREFQYDPQQDVYTCPQGALLRLKKHRYTERTKVYRADAATCNACPLKKHCTESQHGRSLKRSFDEEALEQVRASHATGAVPKSHAQAQRLGRAVICRGQGLAWHEALSPATTPAGEL
jgi:transposase